MDIVRKRKKGHSIGLTDPNSFNNVNPGMAQLIRELQEKVTLLEKQPQKVIQKNENENFQPYDDSKLKKRVANNEKAIKELQEAELANTKESVKNRIYVAKDADGKNDGTSWENAFNSLDEALICSKEKVVLENIHIQVWVKMGIYQPSCNINDAPTSSTNACFKMRSHVHLYGGFDGTEKSIKKRQKNNKTTLFSNDVKQLLVIKNNIDNVIIDGFKFEGACNQQFVSEYNSGFLVRDCEFKGLDQRVPLGYNAQSLYFYSIIDSAGTGGFINCSFHNFEHSLSLPARAHGQDSTSSSIPNGGNGNYGGNGGDGYNSNSNNNRPGNGGHGGSSQINNAPLARIAHSVIKDCNFYDISQKLNGRNGGNGGNGGNSGELCLEYCGGNGGNGGNGTHFVISAVALNCSQGSLENCTFHDNSYSTNVDECEGGYGGNGGLSYHNDSGSAGEDGISGRVSFQAYTNVNYYLGPDMEIINSN